MKNILFILLALPLLAFATSEIDNATLGDYKAHGGLDTENSSFKSLNVHGGLEFKNIHIDGEALIHGGAEGRKLDAGSLKVHGGVEARDVDIRNHASIHGKSKLQNAHFQGDFECYGKMHAKESRFKNILTGSKKIILEDVEVDGNIIFESTYNNEPQTLYLKGETNIRGNVEFISGKGKIYFSRGSKIHGDVK